MEAQNRLFYGDCLDVLKTLPGESIDLIYLDPPFNSKRDYNAFFSTEAHGDADAQITAFEDTWRWGEQAEREYGKMLRNPESGSLGETLLPALRQFLAESDMMAYLVMMGSRLVEMRRVLKETGSLYLHCDPTASHYLKIVLDGIFGAANFKNEIVWKRTSAHNDAKTSLASLHDIIFHYTKSDKFTRNKQFVPYDEKYVKSKYNKAGDDGRLYRTDNLTAMGLSGGGYEYEWNGVRKIWRCPIERMQELHDNGRLKYTKQGTAEYIRYLDEMPGLPLGDIWTDIPPINSQADERLGYPTQKPTELLERIIRASSNEGDVVLDPFCGCGTAIHAAERLKRRWIGIDITHLAIGLIKQRLKKAFPNIRFTEEGTPKDIASARHLAQSSADGRYQFQYWALFMAGALPAQGKKKGADGGIDGYVWFTDSPNPKAQQKKIIVSVKSGKIPANHIRELSGLLKGQTEIAVLITLEEPSRVMKADAVAAGHFTYPNGHEVPRIQILTVKDLLEGKKIDYIDYSEGKGMNKQAKREIQEKQGTLIG